MFYTFSNLANPPDLYAVGFGGGKTAQLTRLNQPTLAQRRLGDYEQFSFAGWNDENVFGYVVKPADFKPARNIPSPSSYTAVPRAAWRMNGTGAGTHKRWPAPATAWS